MSLLSYCAGLCADAATACVLTTVANCNKSGIKFIDKFIVPVGIMCISATVCDIVDEHVDNDIKTVKESFEAMRMLNEEKKKAAEDIFNKYKAEKEAESNIIHNVFDNDINKTSEEVNADGNS